MLQVARDSDDPAAEMLANIDWEAKMGASELFLNRMRELDTMDALAEEVEKRGFTVAIGIPHSYSFFVPSEDMEAHPEYGALIGQERITRKSQPCTGNPDVQELFVRRARELFERYPWIETLGICQNDSARWCECDLCRSLDDPRDPTNRARRVVLLANHIARELKDTFPAKRFAILGVYQVVGAPPEDLPLDPAVRVILAPHMSGGYRYPLDSGLTGYARTWEPLIRAWLAKAPGRAFLHEYYRKSYHFGFLWPFANAIKADAETCPRMGLAGAYTQSGIGSWWMRGRNLWLMHKLYWNSDLDVNELIDQWALSYWGTRAGPHVAAWVKTYEDGFLEWEGNLDAGEYHHVPPERTARARAHLEAALAAADNEKILV